MMLELTRVAPATAMRSPPSRQYMSTVAALPLATSRLEETSLNWAAMKLDRLQWCLVGRKYSASQHEMLELVGVRVMEVSGGCFLVSK